jgi:hypothetical protein
MHLNRGGQSWRGGQADDLKLTAREMAAHMKHRQQIVEMVSIVDVRER